MESEVNATSWEMGDGESVGAYFLMCKNFNPKPSGLAQMISLFILAYLAFFNGMVSVTVCPTSKRCRVSINTPDGLMSLAIPLSVLFRVVKMMFLE